MSTIQKAKQNLSTTTNRNSISSNLQKSPFSKTPLLEKGELIKGIIIDIRPSFLTIKTEDNKKINATLADANECTIGEAKLFKVVDSEDNQLPSLKILQSEFTPEDVILVKALEESDLPCTDYYMSLVRELLQNNLSINKETLSYYIKLSHQHNNASFSSLIFLEKHKIAITENNLTQIEAYQNSVHQITYQYEELLEQLSNLLHQLTSSKDASIILNCLKKLTIFSSPESSNNTLTDSSIILSEESHPTYEEKTNSTPNQQFFHLTKKFNSFFNKKNSSCVIQETYKPTEVSLNFDELSQLANYLEPFCSKEELHSSLEQKQLTLRNLSHIIYDCIRMHSEEFNSTDLEEFQHPVIEKILSAFDKLQQENNELGSYLSQETLDELATILEEIFCDAKTNPLVNHGEITGSFLLQTIMENLDLISPDNKLALLKHPYFNSLIKEHLLDQFFIQPGDLQEENKVTSIYSNLSNQLKEFQETIAQMSNSTAKSTVLQKSFQIEEQLSFLKILNQVATYVQLPLNLTNQLTHADLYVYTKKKNWNTTSEPVSALLHLDLSNAGTLDIAITLFHRSLTSKFYIEQPSTLQLIKEHIPDLNNRLSEKGYQTILETHSKKGNVQHLLNKMTHDQELPSIKRYSFDMRT